MEEDFGEGSGGDGDWRRRRLGLEGLGANLTWVVNYDYCA